MKYAEGYKDYLDSGKTEREITKSTEKILREHGYTEYTIGDDLRAGGKYFYNNKGKNIYAFHIGSRPVSEGIRILAAHIDSPRLDLKQNPLYESDSLALLETHYYGGVKKYQWVARPMALHGIVVKKEGTSINVSIGEKDDEPVVGVSDLLIHLAAKQMDNKGARVVEGEDLIILIGSIPLEGEETEPVKANILKILKEKYDMTVACIKEVDE